jgi:hypothetical protein
MTSTHRILVTMKEIAFPLKREIIDKITVPLNPRQVDIMGSRSNGVTLKVLALKYGISGTRVRAIQLTALRRMNAYLYQAYSGTALELMQGFSHDFFYANIEGENLVRRMDKVILDATTHIPECLMTGCDYRMSRITSGMLLGGSERVIAPEFGISEIRVRQIFISSLLTIGCALFEQGLEKDFPALHVLVEDAFYLVAHVKNEEFMVYRASYEAYSSLSCKRKGLLVF